MESSEGEGTEKGHVNSGGQIDPTRGLAAAFGLPKPMTNIEPMGRNVTVGKYIT